MRRAAFLILAGSALAAGCAESHGRGGPDPEPMPEPLPVDAGPGPCRPEPCYAWDPMLACCHPDDVVLPDGCGAACPVGYQPASTCGATCEAAPPPEPEPECAADGFRDMGFTPGAAVSSDPVGAMIVAVSAEDGPGGPVAIELALPEGSTATFRAPPGHAEELTPGVVVQASIDWSGGARASRLSWDFGQVVAFESSSLPGDALRVGEVSLALGSTLCTSENPDCGTERRYALEVARGDGTPAELGWGEVIDLPHTPVDGAAYRVSFGQAIDYGCETCACLVGYHFSAVVTERYGG
jgi:hypothetical protein